MNISPAIGEQEAFGTLCDLVAGGRLVLVTGSGVSAGLRRADKPNESLQTWRGCLTRVRAEFRAHTSRRPAHDEHLVALLHADVPNPDLVLASSLLEQEDSRLFHRRLASALTPRPLRLQPQNVRREKMRLLTSMLAVRPRGIITYNVDRVQEQHCRRQRLNPLIVDPASEPVAAETHIRALIRDGLSRFFIMKAHGSLNPGKVVFSRSAYRALLEKNPAYRTFMHHLLLSANMLFVGFGFADPDFEFFRTAVDMQLGGGVLRHVAFDRPVRNKRNGRLVNPALSHLDRAREATLSASGIEVLWLGRHEHIPEVLHAATVTPGSLVTQVMIDCVSERTTTRQSAHGRLRGLADAGLVMVTRAILAELEPLSRGQRRNSRKRAELIYACRKFVCPDATLERQLSRTLRDILVSSRSAEAVAHSLLALERRLRPGDYQLMQHTLDRWSTRTAGIDARVAHYVRSVWGQVIASEVAAGRHAPPQLHETS